MILLAGVADKVFSLVQGTVEENGVSLWDVRFVKEGANWYLRIIIDSDAGISIDDCTNVSHAIDPVIDEADPIDKSYYLEVCSPGLERELVREEHYTKMVGEKIKVKLYKAIDGVKEFTGVLKNVGEEIVIETEQGDKSFTLKEISKAHLCDFE